MHTCQTTFVSPNNESNITCLGMAGIIPVGSKTENTY